MKKLMTPVLAAAVLVSAMGVSATVLHVPSEYPTIQAGIDAATEGDTVLVAHGTYTGDGNRDIDFSGKAIVVRSQYGPEATIIDCEGSPLYLHRGFHFHSGEDSSSVMQGFTIRNGYQSDGGGIYCYNSSPTITGNTITGNMAGDHGGGMFNGSSSSPTVTDCAFIGNSAGTVGGGMHNDTSSPTVTDCAFSGNSAPERGGGMSNSYSYPTVTDCAFIGNSGGLGGGGMRSVNSSPTVTNCTFSQNWAHGGGGMANSVSSSTVTNCTFSGNSATATNGGGMSNWGSSNPTVSNCTFSGNSAAEAGGGMNNYGGLSTPTVSNCTFSGNSAGTIGGGMRNYGNSPTVSNCTFSGNSAAEAGGGMFNWSSQVATVTNCTFSGNSSGTTGGGMRNYFSSPTVSNCTFSGNSAAEAGGGMYNSSSSDPTLNNCILWGDLPDEIDNDTTSTPNVTYSDVEGGWSGEGNIDADPMFVLAEMSDYRLLWGSPCIDTGDPNLYDPDLTRSDMGAHYFNQDDYLTLYLTPDMTEVSPGGELGVTYTVINRWAQPEPFWVLTEAILPNGNPKAIIGPDQYTLPANTSVQRHLNHNVPGAAPLGVYGYRSRIGVPPSTLYDEDRFRFTVVEP